MVRDDDRTYQWLTTDIEGSDWGAVTASERITTFVATFRLAALTSQATDQIPALFTLGQAALESGWGDHAPGFNFFGMKAKANDPLEKRQLLKTVEVLNNPHQNFPEVISVTPLPNGKFRYVVRDWFRKYPDAAAGFIDHGQLLRSKPRYAAAFAFTEKPRRFADAIADAGYATDPNYKSLLRSVMQRIEPLLAGA